MKGLGHFPMSEDPREVHRLSAAGAGRDPRRQQEGERRMKSVRSRHTLQPAAGATDHDRQLRERPALRRSRDEVRYYARRHLLDTVGVMIAGAPRRRRDQCRDDARGGAPRRQRSRCRAARRRARPARRRLPRRHRGARHRARRRLPRRLGALRLHRRAGGAQRRLRARRAAARADRGGGRRLRGRRSASRAPARPTCASAASIRPARSARSAPRWRSPSCAASTPQQIADALGIAASAAAGLFAFVNGGADIKRLHAGHASREGMQAALLAEQGVEGPPNVIEARDGFMQAFAFGRSDKARADHAAARRAVRHHRLLHQALCLLPPHPARGRGAVRPDERREDRRSTTSSTSTSRPIASPPSTRTCRLGRLRQRAAELPVSDGPRGALSAASRCEHFNEETRQRSGLRRVRQASSPSRRRPRSTGSIRSCARRASR